MRTSSLFAVFTSASLLLPALNAAIVYDNGKSEHDLGFSYDSRFEFGDEIVLSGTQRWITEFMFEYYADFTPTGDEKAVLRFYANDGPAGGNPSPTPGTLLFESQEFTLLSGYRRGRVEGLGFQIPDIFTWTIEFKGLSEGERAGLLMFEAPTVGQSGDDFWERRAEGWMKLEFEELPANFAARVIATYAPGSVVVQGIEVDGGVATVEVAATPGRFYRLLYINAVGEEWEAVEGEAVEATSETVELQDPEAGSAPIRFYRVEESAGEV